MTNGNEIKRDKRIRMSPETAELVSSVANWVLIASLVCGVVATYGIVISGNIKDANFKEKLKIADEHIEVLKNETEDLRHKNLLLEKQMQPRRLSGAETSKIVKSLSSNPPQAVFVASKSLNSEATDFSEDISAALKSAGWAIFTTHTWVGNGAGITVGSVNNTASTGVNLLDNALTVAGISHSVTASIDTTQQTLPQSFQNGVVYIFVGEK